MAVPRNTSPLLEKIKNAKGGKKPEVKPTPKTEEERVIDNGGASAGREAAKLRQRAKKAEADVVTLTAERDALKAENDSLRPKAKKWDDYDHIERSKLIEALPPELKKEAKDMPLHHLRLFTKSKAEGDGGTGDGGKPKDDGTLDSVLASKDPKKINEYMEKVRKGDVTPVSKTITPEGVKA